MGDANADTESRMANSGTNLQADILKVGHHGSATYPAQPSYPKHNLKPVLSKLGPGIPMATQHQNPMVAWPRWGPLCTAPT